MRSGLFLLALAYVLSQFFRAFLAVLAGPLESDLGLTPDDLAFASGLWFLSFAAMQLPVGWALDTIGPRRTAAALLLVGGGGGAALFAMATNAVHIDIAMVLIGIGCSPVLMASYYIFAREFPPLQFATLAALMVGVGTVGNLIASYPMAMSAEMIGWRASMGGLASLSAVVAIGVALTVRDPAKPESDLRGSVFDLLKMPVLWLILPLTFVHYAPAGAIRGLWIGPYLRDVFDASQSQIGMATLMMGLAMIAGVVMYGPLDRLVGSRKWVNFTGNALTAAVVLTLWAMPQPGMWTAVALMCAVGLFGASFPVMIAHGRSFVPPHLTGRGVTLLNLFGIGGVGLMQFASGRLHAGAQGGDVAAPYAAIFGFFGLALVAGLAVYLFSRDNTA
ncbi:MFS transporter [Pseudosulfitobacter pseudonitzschiae]|uniref:MFS transporter n=1 Tax=Pseudosulfitobacter pseudonitzschiae TaxID=1402135 RepID=UPI001AFC8DDD|nr:MFS transporter [Pseudosulfitobacter pseudonitzschiae]MBM1815782.1 MFS transporter [Pseudosulfitobacter pseudonitzschiae]MBM1832773.1 MFS transporter [Pseudosulfitobacter pseudonitzschiae]MBM1837641.1 MFS transporter [Pseudosulfitobacter pseudonitzschiae]MBM1842487.1 MFS transporter [Pseudosulfitobacter pseudonitzschiae]MBM1847355.1 MFS transporter [Pseudosulfitobacter pseudonitzschiae]